MFKKNNSIGGFMKKFFYAFLVLSILGITGCSNQLKDSNRTGIVITLPGAGRSVENDMEIKAFSASVQKSSGKMVKELTNLKPGETVLIEGISSGNYTVTIKAYSATDTVVAEGSSEVEVVANKTTQISITLKWQNKDITIHIGSISIDILCTDFSGRSVKNNDTFFFMKEDAYLNFKINTNVVDPDSLKVLLNGKEIEAKDNFNIYVTRQIGMLNKNALEVIIEKDGVVQSKVFEFGVEYGYELNSLLWTGNKYSFIDVVNKNTGFDRVINDVIDFTINENGDIYYFTSGNEIFNYKNGSSVSRSGIRITAIYATDTNVYALTEGYLLVIDGKDFTKSKTTYEIETMNGNRVFAIYETGDDFYIYTTYDRTNIAVYKDSIKNDNYHIEEFGTDDWTSGTEVTDMRVIGNELYVLIRDHYVSISRGMIIKYAIGEDGKLTKKAAFGLFEDTDINAEENKLKALNLENGHYSVEEFEKQFFYGCSKIVAIKPKELIIADEGFVYVGSFDMKNQDRLVVFDLESFSIKDSMDVSFDFDDYATFTDGGSGFNDIGFVSNK